MPRLQGRHTKPKHSQKGLSYSNKKRYVVQKLLKVKARRNCRNKYFSEIGKSLEKKTDLFGNRI